MTWYEENMTLSVQSRRGVETMIRVSAGNQQRLSDKAGNKAHIYLPVNSIFLSVIITVLLKKLAMPE